MRRFFIVVFTPLARHLAGVHPNTITVFSVITGCCAGLAYALAGRGAGFYLVGGALVALSGMGDSLDGIVARTYGLTSRKGDFLDHFFDRVINIAIFAGLAFSPGASAPLGLGTVIVVMLNSYLGTQIEASFGQRYYGGLGKAELFVALVAASVLLACLPGFTIPLGDRSVTLINLLFALLCVFTTLGLIHRFRYALRLCAAEDGKAS